jgi:hypothetical protein
LDDLDVVDEDRRSSLTTASSRDDEFAGDEEPVVPRNGPPRPSLASILVSIPPPPTPPPPEIEVDSDECRKVTAHQRYQLQLNQPARRISPYSATDHSNKPSFIPPRPPTSPPKGGSQQKVSIRRDIHLPMAFSLWYIVCVALCVAFCSSVVCHFVLYVYFCELSLIAVQLAPATDPFTVQLNSNNNNNNNNNMRRELCFSFDSHTYFQQFGVVYFTILLV